MEEYLKVVSEVKTAHLEWLSQHKNYIEPTCGYRYDLYREIIDKELYKCFVTSVTWWAMRMSVEEFKIYLITCHFKGDVKSFLNNSVSQPLIQSVISLVTPAVPDSEKFWFITIGFNHQTWSVRSSINVIDSIVSNKIFKEIRGVFELFRENGEHPHVHFLCRLLDNLPKSKIIEKLWATKGIKKVVLAKTFIDIKRAGQQHEKYILGDKTESKLSYCQKDKDFRKKNNIPEFFSQPIL